MEEKSFKREGNRILSLFPWTSKYDHLVAGFTTKNGGVSTGNFSSLNVGLHVNDEEKAVVANRKLISEDVQFSLENWICSEQTHGNRIEKVAKNDCGKGVKQYGTAVKDTDGIYTDEQDILLTSYYADCVPLYYFSPTSQYIGLAHAGWKGTVLNIAGKMVERWIEEGVDIADIHVAIGPSIGKCCYVVDDTVRNRLEDVLGEQAAYTYKESKQGQYMVDLKEANRRLLVNARIKPENIIVSTSCTCCEDYLFFSHRRDKGKTGRMMSFIGTRSE
ncbi:MAG: peptidoglycan editing factor PgeF [Bacillaceae bacterium]